MIKSLGLQIIDQAINPVWDLLKYELRNKISDQVVPQTHKVWLSIYYELWSKTDDQIRIGIFNKVIENYK